MNNKLQQTSHERRATSDKCVGSALILAVVLTSLLAIVGVLFVMVGRVNKIATSAISENRELNLAVDTVIAKISQELVLDVPGLIIDANEEYYDYPDVNNIWLACLEPYKDGTVYKWRQTSDVYGRLDANALGLQADIIDDYQASIAQGLEADADGDGVSDSVWVTIPDMTSNKGKPIYAAVRVVDNGGMLNVNTAYKFDPCEPFPIEELRKRIDGSSQMQINLFALSERGTTNTIDQLDDARFGSELHILDNYIRDVVWRYYDSNGAYTPFDISDELELRNRFLLEFEHINTRIEKEVWTSAFTGKDYLHVPVDGTSSNLNDWFIRAQYDLSEPNKYSYRHISTTYNMDRIINPRGSKMVNINNLDGLNPADVDLLYSAIYAGFYDADFNSPLAAQTAAQTAVNLIDFRDSDNIVTIFPFVDVNYYGFEAQPFISEIAFRIDESDPTSNNYFALELYNPFDVDIPLDDFRLELRLAGVPKYTVNLAGFVAANDRFVITNASSAFGISADQVDPNLVLATYTPIPDTDPIEYTLSERYDIYLLRTTAVEPNLCLDIQGTDDVDFTWNMVNGVPQFYCRRGNNWNIVYQVFEPADNTLGVANGLVGGRTNYNIPTFTGGFVTVGDIARVLTIGPSTDPNDTIGARVALQPDEQVIRLNLIDSRFQQIFNYLTVFPPAEYVPDPNETRIKGRININTAPWFVLAQLPWVTDPTLAVDDPNRYGLARAIVEHRESGAFNSIGELMNVSGMDYYQTQIGDLLGFPDLTGDDGAADDFEERDVIFARISNLVTVRSDVFTAYVLVRIGEDGPQKRVMAILDRSNVDSPDDKVKIVALHPVPDPR